MIPYKKTVLIAAAVGVLIVAYVGPSAYRQSIVDKEVDRLCSVDGGIKVFERVTLPPSQFNKWGDPNIPFKKTSNASSSPFFIVIESQDLIKDNSVAYNSIHLVRMRAEAIRSVDGKSLGEAISYARMGGDPLGPWHPSSYSACAESGDKNLKKAIFLKD
jgi:hypothetical protein